MDRNQFAEALDALCRRTPFGSFAIELTSGTRLRIEHPEAVILHGDTAVHFASGGRLNLFDHQGVARLTTEPDEGADAPSTN